MQPRDPGGGGHGAGKGVRVYVRVRPMLARELQFDNAVEAAPPGSIKVFLQAQEFASSYDAVFPEHTSQEEVYARVQGEGVGKGGDWEGAGTLPCCHLHGTLLLAS